jgi:formylglycine-generating enzyme required for sulfatase activity
MVCVPAGFFEMGSDEGEDDEEPVRQVCMPTYWIDETEVTVWQYEDCVTDGGCTEPDAGTHCNWEVADREDHPVNCVSWYQARDYCEWKSKRLPTEAEWEKAARGTDGRTYPWGESTPSCDYAVMDDGGFGCETDATMPVGSKSPAGDSPYGAKDTAGNVWEWCADWHGDYDPQEVDDPEGPASGVFRVLRGGCWRDPPDSLRASYRHLFDPSGRAFYAGVRCARTP